jgi:hypothetical protein
MPPVANLDDEHQVAAKDFLESLVVNNSTKTHVAGFKDKADHELKAAFLAEWTKYTLRALPDGAVGAVPCLAKRTIGDDGVTTLASVEERRNFWATYMAKAYPLLTWAALKLLSMHVTTCSAERNWSQWGLVYTKVRNRLQLSRGEKIVFIRANLLPPKVEQAQREIAAALLDDEEGELVMLEEEELGVADDDDEEEDMSGDPMDAS